MEFPFGETVWRDRRASTANQYNPARSVEGDWDPALTIALQGAFVGSSSSNSTKDATRRQVLTLKSLYLTDPDADVLDGDQIRTGGTQTDLSSGTPYLVDARPDADTSPFTGWRPAVEIPLTLREG